MGDTTDKAGNMVKNNLWSVLATLICILVVGYGSHRLTMATYQQKVRELDDSVDKIQSDIGTLQDRRESLRIDVTRMEIKINALLRSRGIDPNELSNNTPYQDESQN